MFRIGLYQDVRLRPFGMPPSSSCLTTSVIRGGKPRGEFFKQSRHRRHCGVAECPFFSLPLAKL